MHNEGHYSSYSCTSCSVNEMLCEVCSRMFSSGNSKGEHHASLASFTRAAADGCYVCSALLASQRRESFQIDSAEFDYTLVRLEPSSAHLDVRIGMRFKQSDGVWWSRGGYNLTAISTPPSAVEHDIRIRKSAIPVAESLQAAQKWMKTCLEKHEQCQKHNKPPAYPTRLLELGSNELRLILPRDEKLSGPYAALSYCWGPNPSFIRLTADNLQELRLGLPYSKLPTSFQEAIQFVKGLKIRYLWIDALCIIQSGFGSFEDWRSECGRMQDVFSNCVVNLTLAQASHPNQSCLNGYTSNEMLAFNASIVYTLDGHETKEAHPYTIIPDHYFRDGLYNQPVGRRAWVLQERLLATRVLSIGRGELFWDCQQLPHASESLPRGFECCSDSIRESLSPIMALSIPSIPQISTRENLEATWQQILIEYTARDLTYPQADKLAALSAIAARMGSAMRDEYIAGHFWKTLPRSLLWQRNESTSLSNYSGKMPYRLAQSSNHMLGSNWIITPSWSWASMHGPLTMSYHRENKFRLLANAESYKLVPVHGKDIGERVDNLLLLTIRAWCRICLGHSSPVGPDLMWILGPQVTDDPTVQVDSYIDDAQNKVDYEGECLLAGIGSDACGVHGLLLREIEVNGEKAFERFGWFKLSSLGHGPDLVVKWFSHGQQSVTVC